MEIVLGSLKIWKTSSERELRFFRSRFLFVCGENPLSLSKICWWSGVPIEGEREGESRSFRDRKGQVFPAREPRKGHSESTEAKGQGVFSQEHLLSGEERVSPKASSA